jgi:glycerol-3-phosphate acyltransferase PlsY
MQITYILICIGFYLIGSIPNAFLLVKRKTGKDLRNLGTGNIGAMNSFDVTKSKKLGIAVYLLDFLKAFIPTFIFLKFIPLSPNYLILPVVLLLIGHNYSVWLKFKGGRGLAPAGGLLIMINYWFLIAWCVFYVISFTIKKNVHIGSVVATILLPVFLIISFKFILPFSYPSIIMLSNNFQFFIILISLISIIILSKHIEPIVQMFNNKNSQTEDIN